MADQKISQLNSLTGANTASGDLVTVVDISDTTMGASGTNKKMTLTEFQASPVSAGTANGVVFLNGSKVSTAGSALTFDGTNLATTGTASATKLIPTGGTATGNGMYLPSANTLGFSTNGVLNMSLDASGNVQIGGTSALSGAKFSVDASVAQPALAAFVTAANLGAAGIFSKFDNDSTTSNILLQFLINNGTVGSGQINANGGAQAAFGSYSDIRLKENVENLPSQLGNVCTLRPVEFDYIDGSGHQIGFIAQEMQQVFPDAIGTSAEGMLTVTGWGKTEARLVKAIQEQQVIIESLRARIEALENGVAQASIKPDEAE